MAKILFLAAATLFKSPLLVKLQNARIVGVDAILPSIIALPGDQGILEESGAHPAMGCVNLEKHDLL